MLCKNNKHVNYSTPASTSRKASGLAEKTIEQRQVKPWSQPWLIAAGAYPGFCSMKRLEVFLLPLDGMLVHRRSLPRNFVRFPQQIAGTHLYTWVERGTVRVKCLAQEHNTMSPARARTRSASSGVERTNHEATEPPQTDNERQTMNKRDKCETESELTLLVLKGCVAYGK